MEFTITLTVDDSIASDAIDILATNFGYNQETDGDKTEFVKQKEEEHLKSLIMNTIRKAKEKQARVEVGKVVSALNEAINFEIV